MVLAAAGEEQNPVPRLHHSVQERAHVLVNRVVQRPARVVGVPVPVVCEGAVNVENVCGGEARARLVLR